MKDVFTYWEPPPGSETPAHIYLWLETLERNCSRDFSVHILDQSTIREYLGGDAIAGEFGRIETVTGR